MRTIPKRNGTANNTIHDNNTVLPLPPENPDLHMESDIHARFIKHLRHVPNSQTDIKILSAIQFTADMLDLTDELVAKVLVDLGLRARRKAFPASYLKYVDRSLMRAGWSIGGPTASSLALKKHWDQIGEDRFAAFRHAYPLVEEPVTL